MSLEMLLSTPHTHGLITLCPMADPERNGFLAINQEFKATCDIDPAIAPKKDQLYIGFKVTGMEDYDLPVEQLRADMTKMVEYHAMNMMAVGIHQLLVTRKVAAVVWNDQPPENRSNLGMDLQTKEYFAKLPWSHYEFDLVGRALYLGDTIIGQFGHFWMGLGEFVSVEAAITYAKVMFGNQYTAILPLESVLELENIDPTACVHHVPQNRAPPRT